MVKDVLNGISRTLNQVFGDGYEIYKSTDVKQGLKEPCFFIKLLASSRVRRIGLRYYQTQSLDIHYFPAKNGDNDEMISVGNKLFDALEIVALLNGDLVHGIGMNYQMIDGVLHFFVDYNIFIRKTVDQDDMETINVIPNTTG